MLRVWGDPGRPGSSSVRGTGRSSSSPGPSPAVLVGVLVPVLVRATMDLWWVPFGGPR